MGKTKKMDVRPSKVTESELEKMQAAVVVVNKLKVEIANSLMRQDDMKAELKARIEDLSAISTELEGTYPNSEISINDGSVKYKEDEPSDS
tara:strand:+ start:961 stop:1233 length:273 start_codon:yes stop_codon:yes gene_type:complete